MYRALLFSVFAVFSLQAWSDHHGGQGSYGQRLSHDKSMANGFQAEKRHGDKKKYNREHGLTKLQSAHSVSQTTDKLISLLEDKGMKIFNRIDHAAGAKSVDLALRPTELVIFGNPKVGSKLMQCGQTVGLDLPLKMLVWEDEKGKVWLGYYRPARLVKYHQLENCKAAIQKVAGALNNFAKAAAVE